MKAAIIPFFVHPETQEKWVGLIYIPFFVHLETQEKWVGLIYVGRATDYWRVVLAEISESKAAAIPIQRFESRLLSKTMRFAFVPIEVPFDTVEFIEGHFDLYTQCSHKDFDSWFESPVGTGRDRILDQFRTFTIGARLAGFQLFGPHDLVFRPWSVILRKGGSEQEMHALMIIDGILEAI